MNEVGALITQVLDLPRVPTLRVCDGDRPIPSAQGGAVLLVITA